MPYTFNWEVLKVKKMIRMLNRTIQMSTPSKISHSSIPRSLDLIKINQAKNQCNKIFTRNSLKPKTIKWPKSEVLEKQSLSYVSKRGPAWSHKTLLEWPHNKWPQKVLREKAGEIFVYSSLWRSQLSYLFDARVVLISCAKQLFPMLPDLSH